MIVEVKQMKITFDLNYFLEEELNHIDDDIKPKDFDERIELLRDLVFDFNYPIDEKYKDTFERGFISMFLFKEIGFGTYTRWHFELQAHLNVHGTRYNNLYQSELNDIEKAMATVDMESTGDSTNTQDLTSQSTSESDSDSESFTDNRVSDTPQGRREIDGNYISGLSDGKQVSTSGSTGQDTSTQIGESSNVSKSKTKGYSGLTLTQLRRIYAEQMVVANEIVLWDMARLFTQIVI